MYNNINLSNAECFTSLKILFLYTRLKFKLEKQSLDARMFGVEV